MTEEVEQLEVKEIPEGCPVSPPCPVCPPKPKPWQICLRMLLLLTAGLALAFIILACSGLRITRKESLLDIWLASRKGISPTPEVLEPTPTPDPIADWRTYTNEKYDFSIKYPSSWTFREFPDTKDGAGFRPADKPDDVRSECINIHLLPRAADLVSLPFQEYVAKAAVVEIQNYEHLVSLEEITTNVGIVGYKTTWRVRSLDGEELVTSGPITYFDYPKANGDKIQVAMDKGSDCLDVYNQMILTFRLLDQEKPVMINSPDLEDLVRRPLLITGTVEPGWMFEGVFPVKLLDANKKEIARATAKEITPGSWQSGEPVEFSATLTFTTQSASGFLVFENDNPSGLPENSKNFEIPVKFQ
ncbi:MAG: hypothetical protein ACOX50_00520 [Patescibacteria group bacterium]|jgi:hypothetical protein